MKKILIIDDNKDILKALEAGICFYLKDCTVLTALNGRLGKEIMQQQSVDLVVADLDMPVMDGYQFVELARKEHADVPVCVMTGHCSSQLQDRLLSLGVRRIIGKPFLIDQLSSLIAGELGVEWQRGDQAAPTVQ